MNSKLYDKWNKKQQSADQKSRTIHMQYKLETNKHAKREYQLGYLKFRREAQMIGQFMEDANLIQGDG